jgi:N-acetylglucosaminyldiphosphoundecaprenol N-acetyl-beta-D-mannosaminyltransferase
MQPRDLPMEPRAALGQVVLGKARLVGARTRVGRRDLGLVPGVVSPYELRSLMGLRYGDPPIEEARYERQRTRLADAELLARWTLVRLLTGRQAGTAREENGRVDLLGCPMDAIDTTEAVRRIQGWLLQGRSARVFFAHAHALNVAVRDSQLRADFRNADLVLPDGIGVRLGAAAVGHPLPANVNGTDLVPELLHWVATEDMHVALIGGEAGIASRAAARWQLGAPFRLVGAWDGFRSPQQYSDIASRISQHAPVVVLIGFGSPLQERFAYRFFGAYPGVVCISVGGLFDFASGAKPRAPLAWRELGAEWLWRLVHEPQRLGKRYLLGNPRFLARVVAQRLRGRRDTPRVTADG